jgi:hypothetical protein
MAYITWENCNWSPNQQNTSLHDVERRGNGERAAESHGETRRTRSGWRWERVLEGPVQWNFRMFCNIDFWRDHDNMNTRVGCIFHIICRVEEREKTMFCLDLR